MVVCLFGCTTTRLPCTASPSAFPFRSATSRLPCTASPSAFPLRSAISRLPDSGSLSAFPAPSAGKRRGDAGAAATWLGCLPAFPFRSAFAGSVSGRSPSKHGETPLCMADSPCKVTGCRARWYASDYRYGSDAEGRTLPRSNIKVTAKPPSNRTEMAASARRRVFAEPKGRGKLSANGSWQAGSRTEASRNGVPSRPSSARPTAHASDPSAP